MQEQEHGQKNKIQADEDGLLTLKGGQVRGEHRRVGSQFLQHGRASCALAIAQTTLYIVYGDVGQSSAGGITESRDENHNLSRILATEFKILYGVKLHEPPCSLELMMKRVFTV